MCVTMYALTHMMLALVYKLKWIYTYMCPTSICHTGWICYMCTTMSWIGMHVNCWWLALSPTHVKMRCHMWFHMWHNVYVQCICHKLYVTMYMSQCICHNMSQCICHNRHVTMHVLQCICHNRYVTMSMLKYICHNVYVTNNEVACVLHLLT